MDGERSESKSGTIKVVAFLGVRDIGHGLFS